MAGGLIPAGYEWRGAGRCLVLENRNPAADSDSVVSSALLRGPFLVAAVGLSSDTGTGSSCQLSVVGAPLRQAGVAGALLPIAGVQLFPAGPSAPLLAGVGEEAPIGEAWAPYFPTMYWPWYVHPESGALALWVRRHGVAVPTWTAHVSVWDLEQVGPAVAEVFWPQPTYPRFGEYVPGWDRPKSVEVRWFHPWLGHQRVTVVFGR